MQEEPKKRNIDDHASANPPPPPGCANGMPGEEDEINLLDLLIVLLKHKKMIVSVVFLAGVLAVVMSLMMTNIYRSESVLAPTGQEKGAGGLAALG
ncbi:MAG: Wzz/FepE/Etk N-terminal domain-containing protein, partial [Syntrophales bacterium]